jgi:cysteine-rich repeat protein
MGGRAIAAVFATLPLVVLAATGAAQDATCATAPERCVAGGGPPSGDCAFEWLLPAVPTPALPSRTFVCYEGDPYCDTDPDIQDGRCAIPVALCINNHDPRLLCTPTGVAAVAVRRPIPGRPTDTADAANVSALESAVHDGLGVTVLRHGEAYLPGTSNSLPDFCADPVAISVPLKLRRSGAYSRGRRILRVQSLTPDDRRDTDVLRLECRPSTCGNGIVEAHEDCDDANRLNGDGCDQGCRIERPTPTPTPTFTVAPTATRTATAVATATATRTATGTATASGTATATAAATATVTATATGTRTATRTLTPSSTVTATATRTATTTETPTRTETATPTASFTAAPIQLGIVAYRPQTEAYGAPFQRRAVPVSENVTPGVGARINGDDDNGNGVADMFETGVANENDLIELTLQANPIVPPAGYEYVLRRSDPGVYVYVDSSKTNPLLDFNDELPIGFGASTRPVWVERRTAGTSTIELIARPIGGGPTVASAPVQVFAFTSIVIALGGENQTPSDPPDPNHGMFNIASTLYGMGYDVHMYDEDNVGSSGAGAVYDEVVRAVSLRGIGIVSIFGYSHGGGSTHDLADRLNNNRGSIGTFTFPYTAYVDGIRNSSDIDVTSETRLPPATQYHVNYYQRNDTFIRGNSVPGADVDVNVTNTPWGSSLVHGSIDDAPTVRDGVLQPLLARIPR